MRLLLLLVFFSKVAWGQAPQISPGGVVSAGLSPVPSQVIAPNAILSVFGTNFAPAGFAQDVTSGDLINGALPTTLGGVCVTIGGASAYLINVRPNQLNVQAPSSIDTTKPANVSVTVNCGQAGASTSDPVAVATSAAVPEFFYGAQSPDGNNPIAGTNAITGAPIAATTSVQPGDTLTLYATGLGATNPAIPAGQLPASALPTAVPTTVWIGGVPLDPSNVLYAGVAPGFAGLYQINLQIPATAPNGPEPVEIQTGTALSAINGTLNIVNPKVPAPCPPPLIDLFSPDVDYLSSAGPVDLSWWVESATSIAISPGNLTNLPASGDMVENLTSSTSFTLTASGTCGTVSQQLTIPVGAPAISNLQPASAGAPAGGLRAGDVGSVALGIDPSASQGIVFTAPTGEQYVAQIEFVDAQGLAYFRVPFVPELATATAPVAYQAGALIDGQVLGSAKVSFLPLSYSGNALADFKAAAATFFGQLQLNATNQNQVAALSPAAGIIGTTVSAYTGVINQMIASLASGTAQIPDDLPSSYNPSPASEAITTHDIANLMAYIANYRIGDAVLNPPPPATSSARLQPRGSNGPGLCLRDTPVFGQLLQACIGYQQAQDAVFNSALKEMGQWNGAASALTPKATAALGAAIAKFNNAKLAADSTCNFLPLWLRNFTIYPRYPGSSLQHISVNPNEQDVSVFANLGSGDFGSDVLNYAEKQAVNGILNKLITQSSSITLGTPGVGDRVTAIVKSGNGYLKDQLNNAMQKLPPPSASDVHQVGKCDLKDFYSQSAGSHSGGASQTKDANLIVKEIPPSPNDANLLLYQYIGLKNDSVERMFIVPDVTHFLIDSSIRLLLGPSYAQNQARFDGPLAVGNPKGIVPSGTVGLRGEGSNQNNFSSDLPDGGLLLPKNGQRKQQVTSGSAAARMNISQISPNVYRLTQNLATDQTSLTGPSSLSFFTGTATFSAGILNPMVRKGSQPMIVVAVNASGACSLSTTFTASDGTNINRTNDFHGSYSAKAVNGQLMINATLLTTPNARCAITATITLSDQ